jgi:hypothetical protein
MYIQIRNAYKNVLRNPKEKRPFRRLSSQMEG